MNRFSAVSSGYGSPSNGEGLAEFKLNTESFFSERGGLLGSRGFNVAVVDPTSGDQLEPVRNFDPWTTPLSGNAFTALAEYLESLEPGRLVLMAVCDDAGLNALNSCERHRTAPVERLVQTLEAMGSELIGSYCSRGAWSFVTLTGRPGALAEKLSDGPKVTAELLLPARP